jgi:uncharacterized membrane protein YfcA
LDGALVGATAVVFAGGVVSGLAGFGFALVAVPPLLLIFDPPTVVTASILLSILSGWVVLPGHWHEIKSGTIFRLTPWALLGLAPGVALIKTLAPDAIKLLSGLVVAALAAATAAGWRPPGAHSSVAMAVAGATSGMLNASIGMAGPPVVLLFAARDFDMHAFRTSIVVYFLVVDVAGIGLLVWQGVIGWGEVSIALWLLPGALVGGVVGRRLVTRVSAPAFRRTVLAMLLLTGVVGAANGAIGLLR